MTILQAEFIEGRSGNLFVLMRRSQLEPQSGVLIVPPFADEMNKSRKMVTDLATELSQVGVGSVLVDLFGTGDSAGEFQQADWDLWVDDVARTAAWAEGQGCRIRSLLGIRTGCLLAARAAKSLRGVEQSVFWQPVEDGRRYLTQVLRLAVAAAMMDGGSVSVPELREQLRRDGQLEIAGYTVSATLADQLEHLSLAQELSSALGRQHWIEIVRDSQADMSVASLRALAAGRKGGLVISAAAIVGEPFWASTEIVRSSALIDATARALKDGR